MSSPSQQPQQPSGSIFDLRLHLFGIRLCIQPSFWFMNALFAFFIHQYVMGGQGGLSLLLYILIWVLVTLVSVLIHEFGHVIIGRIFGQPGNITLSGLGGQAVGEYGDLSVWKRLLVIMAGPGAGFLFVAFLIAFDPQNSQWNDFVAGLRINSLRIDKGLFESFNAEAWRNSGPIYRFTLMLLLFINLFVNIINLLPIIPMDGGMIFKELCCLISPSQGLRFAFFWSFGLALLVALLHLYFVLIKYTAYTKVPNFLDIHYPFALPEIGLISFSMMAYKCYSSYRQLATIDRHSLYRQRDD